MLIGAIGEMARDRLRLENATREGKASCWLGDQDTAITGVWPTGVHTLDAVGRWAEDSRTGSWIALIGRPFDDNARKEDARPEAASKIAKRLLARLTSQGNEAIRSYDGSFAIVWYDGIFRKLYLIRDNFGVESLYYAELNKGVLFGTRTRNLLATGFLPGGLCPQGLAEYLTYCFVPSDATLDVGVRQVPPAHLLVIDPEHGIIKRERYYRVSFAGPYLGDESEITFRYRNLLEGAILRRNQENRLGVFLSGGMDSSSIVTFTRRHRSGPFHTFSYRCAGKSFDESVYARALAEEMRTEHRELEYDEDSALDIETAVKGMDVPFCDIGLEMGTWLVAKAAQGKVDLILTGDGGDELWASHPVYAAQRLLGWYSRLPIPAFVNRAFQGMVARLPDSDQKRDLRVKLKRILPPEAMPNELGPSRWRAYYTPKDIAAIVVPEIAAAIEKVDPYQLVIAAYEGYNGPDDNLSAHIYNDYQMLTPYYFYRLRLMRRFGLEVRCPYYDRSLVEFGTQLPARLKLEGLERTKRLFRVAMEGILPDVINHRKDKLGHSIPFKNWLRQDGVLAKRVAEICSPTSIKALGIFRPESVSRMLDEHIRRRQNHSHRIWAIFVLERWLKAREGTIC